MEILKEGIYRIKIPFEKIYTASFVLLEGNNAVVLDSGNSGEDAKNHIIPQIKGFNVKYLVSSHNHQDHNGGMEVLRKAFPLAEFVSYNNLPKEKILLKRFKILNLKGHTKDCLGILDLKTNTLLPCDSLQALGIDRFKTYVENKEDYFKTIELVKNIPLGTIITSHEYEPLGGIIEKEKILKFLRICEEAVIKQNE